MKQIAMDCTNQSTEIIKDAIQTLLDNGYEDVGVTQGIDAFEQGFNLLRINSEDKDYVFQKGDYGDFRTLFYKSDLLKHIQEGDSKKDAEVNDDRFPFSLSRSSAMTIINYACSQWATTLSNRWGQELLLGGRIIILESFYKKMRKACTTVQNEIFDEIFGKDVKEPLYKEGDWVKLKSGNFIWKISKVVLQAGDLAYYFKDKSTTLRESSIERLATEEEIQEATFPKEGAWCLVSDEKEYWCLRKYAGKGMFEYPIQELTEKWKYFHVIDQNNLPEIIEK
jgi:hypothetical protein